VTIAASTAAADITGIVLAGVIATIGLFIVPARRRKAKEHLRQKVHDLRDTLSRALRAQFQQEVQHSSARLNDGIAPYSRFVRAEQQSLVTVRDTLADVQARLGGLKARIDALM
jgi:lipopolysaccharide export LptBFGC system permease protein LptF